MTLYVQVVAASLSASVFFAVAPALKHRSAGQTPDAQQFGARQVGRFIAATASNPLYLGGLVCDAGRLGLQVYALRIGALSVVQPLMISALLTSLVLNHRSAGTRLTSAEVWWAGVLVVSLVGFLFASGAVEAARTASPLADHGPATVAGIVAIVAAGSCVVIARRLSRRGADRDRGRHHVRLHGRADQELHEHLRPRPRGANEQLAAVCPGDGGSHRPPAQPARVPGRAVDVQPAGDSDRRPLLSVALGMFVYDERLRPGFLAGLGDAGFLASLSAAANVLSRLKGASEEAAVQP